jgi:hypothetical protein
MTEHRRLIATAGGVVAAATAAAIVGERPWTSATEPSAARGAPGRLRFARAGRDWT